MQEIIITALNHSSYPGVALLIAIENIFPPIPSEVILLFGGFMTTYTAMNAWGVIIAATIGSVVGAIVLYLLGRVLNMKRLEQLFGSRLFRLLRLQKEDVAKAEKWFAKCGNAAVLFCRFVPIVRSLISIPAGMAKMKLGLFLRLTVIGTFIWNTVLVLLGQFAGSAWESVVNYFDIYTTVALALILLAVAALVFVFIKKYFLNNTV